ncbi:hypothetical protein E2562_004417 [Oryza meyeriana var. granulata]|uniref:F-box domain-containing protein n=1 Tax=Oryza meyeriana var. granulata TaxID=110450 RepID=A0A6G1CYC9_9ORYZ|nr:hypothetical protein E2562_004417 [Oryza meyeriana var. granulata]
MAPPVGPRAEEEDIPARERGGENRRRVRWWWRRRGGWTATGGGGGRTERRMSVGQLLAVGGRGDKTRERAEFFLSRETIFPSPLAYPTPSAAASDNPNQIGRLPDCLLTTILSFFPLDAARRTAALSCRWRSLWLSAPLHLLDSDLPSPSPFHSAAISRILASHRGDMLLVQPPSKPLPLPPSLLTCCSLRSADLTNCRLPAAAAGAASFPYLHELTLRYVSALSPVLHGLLTGCLALASLSLDRVFGYRSLYVRSRTLRSLTVSVSLRRREEVGEELQDLVIEDAPLLERLLGHNVNWGPSIHVLHVPRLEILGYLGVGIPSLQLGAALFHSMHAVVYYM